MKALRFAFLVVLVAGCASTAKLPGKYGVVFEEASRYDDSIVGALRDRLSTVDVVASPADDAYDAVIVLGQPMNTPRFLTTTPYKETTKTSSVFSMREDFHSGFRFTAMRYEIHRRGAITAEGTVRANQSPLDITAARIPYNQSKLSQTGSGNAPSIDIASQLVKALTTPPAARNR
jgi:hypothetical protein